MERTKMVEEAVKRMGMLELWDMPEESIIEMFKGTGKVYKSVPIGPGGRAGLLYTLTDAEEKLVQDFERQSGCLVYHMIRNEAQVIPYGTNVQYSMLFVSDKEQEWEQERADITGIESYILFPNVYLYSAGDVHPDDEDLSGGYGEVTRIGITMGCGGLCRTLR